MQHCFVHQLVYIENMHRLQPVNRQLNETKANKKNDRKKIQSDNIIAICFKVQKGHLL